MSQKINAPYSIGETEDLTGISQRQIRYWEGRGYIPKAERVVCGEKAYRYFSTTQIEIMLSIKSYLDQGYTLSHASKLANENS